MFCQECGTEISDNAKFCSKCGNAVMPLGIASQKTISNPTVQTNRIVIPDANQNDCSKVLCPNTYNIKKHILVIFFFGFIAFFISVLAFK